jgi:hypothetical protein
VNKILRKGNELLLSQSCGWLEVFDISSATITHSWKIREGYIHIFDIVAIDKTHYLLATSEGILKFNKE